MREKEVVLSDKEHRKLSNLKQSEYPEGVPYGFVISELIDKRLKRLNDE